MEQSSDSRFTFMRHEKEQMALFIAVPKNHHIDDAYLTEVSNGAVSQLLPQQKGFVWKVLHHPEPEMSAYQIGLGTTKGLNKKMYVQTDFVIVKAQRQEIVLGTVSVFGNETDSKYHFDAEGIDYSFTGWIGLFDLIPSVTNEK